MLDIEKLKRKGELAKEMVNKGTATDIEDALAQIEDNNLVTSFDDFKVSGRSASVEEKIEELSNNENTESENKQETSDAEPDEKLNSIITDPDLVRKIDKLEKSVNELTEFILEFQKKTNGNLRELDKKIVEVKEQKPAQKSEKSEQVQLNKTETINEDSEKTENKTQEEEKDYNVSVESIFSNSHGRMEKARSKKF